MKIKKGHSQIKTTSKIKNKLKYNNQSIKFFFFQTKTYFIVNFNTIQPIKKKYIKFKQSKQSKYN